MKKRFATALTLLFATLILSVVPVAHAAPDGHITVRGDYNYPPYEYLDAGVPTGFNIDIIRAVARAMHLTVKIDLGAWGEVRSQLENGEIEALAGMFYSPERDETVDFSTPHIIVSHAIFIRDGSSVTGLKSLEGKDVVVQHGDIMHDYALEHLPESTIFSVESQADAIKLISNGTHDAALLGKLQTLYIAHKKGYENITPVGGPIEPRRYCIAVREGDEALLAAVNEGLSLIKLSGEYQKIHDKWFGIYEQQISSRRLTHYALYFGAPAAVLLLATLFWTWSLSRAVKHRTNELHVSREHFKAVIENSPLGMALVDPSGKLVLINKELTRMLGYTIEDVPTIDHWWVKAYPDEEYRETIQSSWSTTLEKAKATNAPHILREWKVRTKDGNFREVEFRSTLVGDNVLVILTDQTERKRTADLLIQSEKMMSVGGLAAGMAHEINNPLGGVLQGVQNISRRFSPDLKANQKAAKELGGDMEFLHEYLKRRRIDVMLSGIHESGKRAADIVDNMLRFSRKSESQFSTNDLNGLVEQAIALAQSDYNPSHNYDFRKLEIRENFDPTIPQVECTETEIVQVIFNLLRNAAQAIFENPPQDKTGKITLSTTRKNDRAIVTIEDNGPGMDTDTCRRVFEPFFTTKPPGSGTGLGLSVAYFIITRNHAGEFTVDSTPGKGTTFTIALPLQHR